MYIFNQPQHKVGKNRKEMRYDQEKVIIMAEVFSVIKYGGFPTMKAKVLSTITNVNFKLMLISLYMDDLVFFQCSRSSLFMIMMSISKGKTTFCDLFHNALKKHK